MSANGAIAVFGGTFDPVHYGHLRTAQELLQRLPLAELRFVPARQPPHRGAPAASAEQRAAMVALAIAGQPHLRCERRELTRSGPSYTVDTLESLRGELGPDTPLVLVLGCDALLGLRSWHRRERLLELAHWLVVARPGWSLPALDAPSDGDAFPARLLRERRVEAAELTRRPAGGVLSCALTPRDISSTRIRALLQSSASVEGLLPAAVLAYIQSRGLYMKSPATQE